MGNNARVANVEYRILLHGETSAKLPIFDLQKKQGDARLLLSRCEEP